MSYTCFLATKQGLAAALHSADPAFSTLPDYFRSRFEAQQVCKAAVPNDIRNLDLRPKSAIGLPKSGRSRRRERATFARCLMKHRPLRMATTCWLATTRRGETNKSPEFGTR